MTDLEQAAMREVGTLHAQFACWLGRGEGDLSHAAAALAVTFQMVTPDGALINRSAVFAALEGAQGRRGRGFSIEIADAQARGVGPDHVLVTYVERQRGGGPATARRSSALFKAEPAAPCGVVWLHLQETWLTPAP